MFCYGLSEERPLILLTNRKIHSKDDVIKVVRLYFSRWRIEEYFRAKKQEYKFENIRLRTLKGINNLNLFLTIHLGHINKLAEEINRKLLSIKIIEASKSIRNKVIIWMSQFARGIKKILSYAHTGIKEWQKIEIRDKYKQLALKEMLGKKKCAQESSEILNISKETIIQVRDMIDNKTNYDEISKKLPARNIVLSN